MAEPVWHTYDCRVRWSDVDAYGHVNNVKYFEYFQEARINFWSQVAHVNSGTERVVVARLVVDYKQPIFFRTEPHPIRTRVLSRGESSFELFSEITDGERVLATAWAVVVAFDAGSQASRRLTEDECAFLDRLVAVRPPRGCSP